MKIVINTNQAAEVSTDLFFLALRFLGYLFIIVLVAFLFVSLVLGMKEFFVRADVFLDTLKLLNASS
ncbi:hypothetical protein ACE5JW_11625 [Acinetobacter radioresistens]|jgi:hypothetical protein|uniref:hypothetical protein n=1 Tax=Acinetobacter TaxID=469 RepID=UPI0002D0DCB6|nr:MULTISPECIES: hypothetical protein [Acinetobacter]ENV88169.1 hypothetical protein F940_00015 [Acinetobacter radioresistens NIPH 2130]EXB76826.1 hypothetical protein J538_3334 [Acinetobacter sp. 272263]MCK4078663.1 hypothetical protein [Acinetobacter radioresistens]MCK4084954.1 hypothetical protein [Acinetobacter radioresistens]MCK4087676.1 hypothetical protein [Acinetobacter radioresistens]